MSTITRDRRNGHARAKVLGWSLCEAATIGSVGVGGGLSLGLANNEDFRRHEGNKAWTPCEIP
jgi:hypothetical protein